MRGWGTGEALEKVDFDTGELMRPDRDAIYYNTDDDSIEFIPTTTRNTRYNKWNIPAPNLLTVDDNPYVIL